MVGANSSDRLRLFFHVGAGKTGTTSIQSTLHASEKYLKSQGVWYLGLMLENAGFADFPWQKSTSSEVFHGIPPDLARQQLDSVFEKIFQSARDSGIHTLIWSNESFFGRTGPIRPSLQKLIDGGVDLSIVAYVRRHDVWLRSAYQQWGIKHKTYPGPVQSFSNWAKARPAKFAPAIWSLSTAFPDRFILRNLDAVKDAVADFAQVCGFDPTHLSIRRANTSPGNAELLLRALFNSRQQDAVLPAKFDKAVGSGLTRGVSAETFLSELLPSEADLREVLTSSAEDRRLVNALLVAANQAPLSDESIGSKTNGVDQGELLFMLSQIVMQQAHRIDRLEGIVRRAGLLGNKDANKSS